MRVRAFAVVFVASAVATPGAQAPQPASTAVLDALWTEGMQRSRLDSLAFSLIDSVGPRLTGTPGLASAHRWVSTQYSRWGVDATTETYGTWEGWRRGPTHMDLVWPRARSLDARLQGYSPGFATVRTAKVLTLPRRIDSASVASWKREARGNFILTAPEPRSCRPSESWERGSGSAGAASAKAADDSARGTWIRQIMAVTNRRPDSLLTILERGRVAGLLTTEWSGGWGANRVLAAHSRAVPTVTISCEDYGLLFRLARRSSAPQVRIDARASSLGAVPAQNTIARITGRLLPEEIVLLSAHLDSWDGGSGATDNGSGTLIVMEAMRLLRMHYPHPRRTIVAGHWGGEEQGLNGSKAFVADHPQLVESIHVLFNQDNGSGPIRELALQGFTKVAPVVREWLTNLPHDLSDSLRVSDPGVPEGGSDFASFVCKGVPAIVLGAASFDYSPYTWHTALDTYDKLSFGDLRRNATLLAMLAFLAAETPDRLPRDRVREIADPATGVRMRSEPCQPAARAAKAPRR